MYLTSLAVRLVSDQQRLPEWLGGIFLYLYLILMVAQPVFTFIAWVLGLVLTWRGTVRERAATLTWILLIFPTLFYVLLLSSPRRT